MGYAEYNQGVFDGVIVTDPGKLRSHCDSLSEILSYFRSFLTEEKVEAAPVETVLGDFPEMRKGDMRETSLLYHTYRLYFEWVMLQPVGTYFTTRKGHAINGELYSFMENDLYRDQDVIQIRRRHGTMLGHCSKALSMMIADGVLVKDGHFGYVVCQSKVGSGNR
jgi:hypothetical protein